MLVNTYITSVCVCVCVCVYSLGICSLTLGPADVAVNIYKCMYFRHLLADFQTNTVSSEFGSNRRNILTKVPPLRLFPLSLSLSHTHTHTLALIYIRTYDHARTLSFSAWHLLFPIFGRGWWPLMVNENLPILP